MMTIETRSVTFTTQLDVRQLEVLLGQEIPIGTEAEAQELLDFWMSVSPSNYNWEDRTPPGWTYCGSGGTRSTFKSPTGIAYKVCHRNYKKSQNRESMNLVEHRRFRKIRDEGKLPDNWKVPHSYLYHLSTTELQFTHYDHEDNPQYGPTEVIATVMALEFVDGKVFEYGDEDEAEMRVVFAKIGLFDDYVKNAMKSTNGYRYVVDAAERG